MCALDAAAEAPAAVQVGDGDAPAEGPLLPVVVVVRLARVSGLLPLVLRAEILEGVELGLDLAELPPALEYF